jgi:site-specific recombinase XerD
MKESELDHATPDLGPDKKIGFVINVKETKNGKSLVTLSSTTKKQLDKYLKYIKPRLTSVSSPYVFSSSSGKRQARMFLNKNYG